MEDSTFAVVAPEKKDIRTRLSYITTGQIPKVMKGNPLNGNCNKKKPKAATISPKPTLRFVEQPVGGVYTAAAYYTPSGELNHPTQLLPRDEPHQKSARESWRCSSFAVTSKEDGLLRFPVRIVIIP
ncbi:hypothetical protein ONS95_011435 [Cadophora gregata]|uniref:uncharacterized protein n=1 Tax=Cadophora gregata TaxID=51156 RepID=UPI0026DD48D0|nr:uncharacterized protein ONS95_011435 [Cadophora gregata]KAK0120020.1 hypothetical protein ONS95_011435 [Cadophora gregata]KAK0121053.1 hypothetical protein ONS96_011237 [Cadophora gregata f. sp. sojae]